jgi:Holliday junction resolvase RusA-like endonuclease
VTVALVPKHPARVLILDLTILGEPVPKARVHWKGRRAYTSTKVLHAEMDIEMQARLKVKNPARGAILLDVDFFMGNARKVDWDNLAKLVCDALNGIAWHDDSQIVLAMAGKHVDRERPRTELRVWKVVEE